MTRALIPGSFDPITVGHLDVINRTARFVDHVVVAMGINPRKNYRFADDQRIDFIRRAVADIPGVDVIRMTGSLVECARAVEADIVVKGVRGPVDVAHEATQAAFNLEVGGIETVWMPTRPGLSHVSSSAVRELLSLGMDASRYVPAAIMPFLTDNEAQQH